MAFCTAAEVREQTEKLKSETDVTDYSINKRIAEAESIVKADLSKIISSANFEAIKSFFSEKTKIYDFLSTEDFTSTSKIANGSLILQDDPGNDFTENFDSGAGHTSDTTLEFDSSNLKQINQRPVGAKCYIPYVGIINTAWGGGLQTGTPINGASVVNNYLDLSYNDVRYVTYEAAGNADMQQTGCIRFIISPSYSGFPTTDQDFVFIQKAMSDLKNIIAIKHSSSGNIQVIIFDQTGSSILNHNFGSWSPTQDTDYELELNFDITSGATRFFIDGVQLGTTITATGIRDSNIGIMIIGTNSFGTATSNFRMKKLILFSSVQHTADYVPDWSSIYEYEYLEGYDTLPEMEYTGAGTLVSFDSFPYSIVGNLLVTLQIERSGVWTYWNGSTWATGDGTKDYMCTFADFAANLAALDIEGTVYGQFKIYFPNSSEQGSIDFLTASLTSQIYPTDDPYIIPNIEIEVDEINDIREIITKTGSDDIKRVCLFDGDPYYFDGDNWAVSDYSFIKSNTVVEILAALEDVGVLIGNGISFKQAYIFHSENGLTTPAITTDTIYYRYDTGEYSAIQLLVLYKACEKTLVKFFGAKRNVKEVNDIQYYQKEYTTLLKKILNGDILIQVGDTKYSTKKYPALSGKKTGKLYPRKGIPGFYPRGVTNSYTDDNIK